MSQPERYVAYYRMPAVGDPVPVRTLDSQKTTIRQFLDGSNHLLVGEFTEVMHPDYRSETSPAFELALQCCRNHDARLIAALDEIAMAGPTRWRADSEGIEVLLIDGSATVADATDDAPYLALGAVPRPPVPTRPGAKRRRPAGNREKADRFARAILPIIDQIRATGATTLTDIADELNARQVRTARGRRWYPTTVRNLLNRRPADADD